MQDFATIHSITSPGLGHFQLRDQSAAHARAHVQHAAGFPDHGTGLRLEGLWRRWMAMGGNSFYGKSPWKSHGNHMEMCHEIYGELMFFFFSFVHFMRVQEVGKTKNRCVRAWP